MFALGAAFLAIGLGQLALSSTGVGGTFLALGVVFLAIGASKRKSERDDAR
jgi:hypothetical protein